jgi:hypothetical protein
VGGVHLVPRCVLERVRILFVLFIVVRSKGSRCLVADSGEVLNMKDETNELENEFYHSVKSIPESPKPYFGCWRVPAVVRL